MNMRKYENQVYIIDLRLVTKRRDVQIKIDSTDVVRRHLIGCEAGVRSCDKRALIGRAGGVVTMYTVGLRF